MPERRSILVRATNWVGDAVMSLPALRELRRLEPSAHIAILALPSIAGLYARETCAGEIILLQGRRGGRDFGVKWRQARELSRRGFDLALLLPNSFESAALVRAAGVPERVGYHRDGRRLLLTRPVAVPRPGEIPRHEAYYYLELLRRAGWNVAMPGEVVIRLEGVEAARAAGTLMLEGAGLSGPVIGISPGAAYGTAKRWLPERFIEGAVRLAGELTGSVAVFGTPDEAELCAAIHAALRGAGVRAQDFAGKTSLPGFVDAAAACRVFLTNDSGSMHIASALGIPTVAVFGATDHVGTGPTGPLARVVRHTVDCSPYPHPCLRRECPIDHRCMQAVTADEVVRTALDLLK